MFPAFDVGDCKCSSGALDVLGQLLRRLLLEMSGGSDSTRKRLRPAVAHHGPVDSTAPAVCRGRARSLLTVGLDVCCCR